MTVDTTIMAGLVAQHGEEARGGSKAQGEPQGTALLVGQATDSGAVVSTVTVCVQEAVKPEQLVTTHLKAMTCGQKLLVTLLCVRT